MRDALPIVGCLIIAGWLSSVAIAQDRDEADPARSNLLRLVKRFDFNERPRGNFEDTPMHWRRFSGAGLPAYAFGRFDETVGHDAPPAFHLGLRGGNVGYEYAQVDLLVQPQAEYVVAGYIRTKSLTHARAFLVAYFADRDGNAILESQRVSALVWSDGQAPEWTRVEIAMPGDIDGAYTLRLQTWVLQTHVWRPPQAEGADPIVRQDVRGEAWFDDISVFHLPRARMRLSNAGGIVAPGAREHVLIELGQASGPALRATLRILDERNALVEERELLLAANDKRESHSALRLADDTSNLPEARGAGRRWRHAQSASLPNLPPGCYTAQVQVTIASELLLNRELRFCVLPELPLTATLAPSIGVNLGAFPGGRSQGPRELLAALRVGTLKVGVPIGSDQTPDERAEYFAELHDLLSELIERGIEPVGVLRAAPQPVGRSSIRQLIASQERLRSVFSPLLGHFGGILASWQLGEARDELWAEERWDPLAIDGLGAYLTRYVTAPELVVPQFADAYSPLAGRTSSVLVRHDAPTRELAAHVADAAASGQAWLDLEAHEDEALDPQAREADFARRFILLRALNPQRLFVPAPFDTSQQAGALVWQPSERFVVLRTLITFLGNRQPVGVISHEPHVTGIAFRDEQTSVVAIWSWREQPGHEVELYFGPGAAAVDLWGRPLKIKQVGSRIRLPLSASPILIYDVDTPLALLQSSFNIAPTHLEGQQPEPRPVLTFRNHYDHALSGSLKIRGPESWRVKPDTLPFHLRPGERLEKALDIRIPPRQLTAKNALDVQIALDTAQPTDMEFVVPMSIGLRDIQVSATARWSGNVLLVEQTLRNVSTEQVSFTAFCEVPNHPRAEAEFLEVAGGEAMTRTYAFQNARELRGELAHVGVVELRGKRRLEQLVQIPE